MVGQHQRSAPRGRRRAAPFEIVNGALLVLFGLVVFYPFWDLVLTSFSNPQVTTSLGFHVWITEWRLDSYQYALSDPLVGYGYLNTVLRTAAGTVLTVLMTVIAAYPLSKKALPGRGIITTYFLITMFFSGGLIPFYLLIRSLGLIDSLWSLILPSAMNVYYVIIMRNYLMGIDGELEESAFIDGAGYLRILVSVIVPLSSPVIATVVLWTAVHHWNEWFHALIFIRDDRKIVLQLLLRRMLLLMKVEAESMMDFNVTQHKEIIGATVRAAITVITIGPIVAVYPFLQRYFVKGIMVGSLKG